MNLFSLAAVISLDSSGFMNGLKAASSAAGNFASGAGGALESFGSKAAAALGAVGKAASVMLGAASTAAVAFGADAVSVGQSFDKSMSQVAATMGYSVEQLNTEGSEAANTFKQLRDFAQDMGAKTAFSASQAADALNYMALAGYSADTSMKMLPNVLNLAAAGGMELAAASDMITDSQSALGLSLDETAALVDKMAKASSKSNTSVSQLGSAILTVGGTAKAMKGGTTELAQVLGIIADNGVKGAEGGTALRNIILSLTAPTDKAAATLERLGVSVLDSSGNMRSMKDIFADLNRGLGDMTEGQKTAVLSEIFNKVDLKSVNALMATNVSRWDELAGAIDNASGAAQAMADTQLDNLAGDITIFQSALEGVKIAVSDEITPALREFVQLGTQGLSDLGAAIKENGLAGAMDALGPIISDGIGMILKYVPDVVKVGGQILGAVVNGLIENLPLLAEGALTLVTEFGKYLAQSAPDMMKQGEKLLDFIANGVVENLPTLFKSATALVSKFAEYLRENFPSLSESAADAIIWLAQTLTDPDTLSNLLNAALDIIAALVDGFLVAAPKIGDAAPEIIANLVWAILQSMPKIIEVGVEIIRGLAKGMWDSLFDLLLLPDRIGKALVEKFKEFFGIHSPSTVFAELGENLIEGILKGVSDAWRIITDFFAEKAEALIGFLLDTWDTVRQNAFDAWGRVQQVFSDAWDGIKGVWNSAGEWFGERWTDISTAFVGAAEWFSEKFTAAYNAVTGAWNGVGKWFSDRWEDISNAFNSAGKWFSDTFSKAWKSVTDAFGGVKTFFEGVWSDITGVFGNAFEWFKEIGKNIVDGLTAGIGGLWSGFINFLSGKTDEVKDEFEGEQGFDTHSPSKWSEKVFRNILEGGEIGLERGLPAMLDSAKDAVSGIQDALSADPFSVSGGYQLSGGYSYANAPQLAAAGAGYGGAQPIVINIQPSNITLNEQIVGKILWQQIRTQQRARGQ